MTPRRRSLLLLGLALILGGLAASDVASREAELDRRVGPLVPVVVARTPVAAGETLRPERLTVRHVPARFAPRGAFAEPAQLAGQAVHAPLAAGADVTAAALEDPAAETRGGAPVRAGERIAEVVATGSPDLVVPGARVDVLVTRERDTELALQDVEVLTASAAPAGDGGEAGGGAQRVAVALRVTLRQAVFLTAAQSFSRELRLLPRAAGDRRRADPIRDVG